MGPSMAPMPKMAMAVAVFFPGKGFEQDGLADRNEPAAADALEDPEEHEAVAGSRPSRT